MIDIAKELKDHMDACIYRVSCHECDNELTYSHTVDSDFDIQVVVEPCEHCLSEKKGEEE